MLHDQREADVLKQVFATKAYMLLKPRLEEFEATLLACEQEMSKLKAKEKAAKNDFAYELTFGKRRV